MLTTILATVVVLGVLIFVHELGHFITAKLADIEVPRFSIGLGPRAWGFQIGETEYVLSWVPLGGYVKMSGMEEMEGFEGGPEEKSEKDAEGEYGEDEQGEEAATPSGKGAGPRNFNSKPVWVRAVVISAGVTMNMLLAVFLYSVIAGVYGYEPPVDARIGSVVEESLPEGTEPLAQIVPDSRVVGVGNRVVRDWRDLQNALTLAGAGETVIRFENAPPLSLELPEEDSIRATLIYALRPAIEPEIGRVVGGMPAEEADLRVGDRILRAGGEPVETWQDLVSIIQENPETPVELVVEREGERINRTVVPEGVEMASAEGAVPDTVGQIGITSIREQPGLAGSLAYGVGETWRWTSFTVEFLGELVTGGMSARNLGGPILIGQLSGRFARAGLEAFLGFMALLSINLAIFNLLPIPVLDGGHLVFLGIEAVRGRALSFEQRMRLTQVGMVFLVALVIWVVASDLLRIFGI